MVYFVKKHGSAHLARNVASVIMDEEYDKHEKTRIACSKVYLRRWCVRSTRHSTGSERNKRLTHIVHLYGRLPRKTLISKPDEKTVSQLEKIREISAQFLQILSDRYIHVETADRMEKLGKVD